MKSPSASATSAGTRRTVEQRREARKLGVDRYGRPTARALGVSPRQLRKLHPELGPKEARSLSLRLVAELRARISRGGIRGAAPPYSTGLPADDGVSPEGPAQPEPPKAA